MPPPVRASQRMAAATCAVVAPTDGDVEPLIRNAGHWLDRVVDPAQIASEMHTPSAGDPTVSRVIRGIRVDVVNTRPDIRTEHVFQRADAVLALVERYQPWRVHHLQRDLASILVKRFACRGAYFPDLRACLLELTFMVNPSFSDAQVAATLVHEGMHARLDQFCEYFGVSPFPHHRARHERICRRAELEFGLAVPDGGPVVQRALESLALEDEDVAPEVDWREAGRRVAQVDRDASG